jgi:hypothetical protein
MEASIASGLSRYICGEIPSRILGGMRHLIDKLARAFLANAAAAEIVAWCLKLVARDDGRIDMGIDARGDIGAAIRHIRGWYIAKGGRVPDESTLKRRLRKFWTIFGPEAQDKAA